jgi:hypothetical protein
VTIVKRGVSMCITEPLVPSERPSTPTRLAVELAALWEPGTELRVSFLDGRRALAERVTEVAREWTRYANIAIVATEMPAPIRVSFRGPASWSLVGRRALSADPGAPTVNLALDDPSASDRVEGTILHEFGHVLGAIHEHASPSASVPWNREAVYAYYGRLGWNRDRVDRNVLNVYERSAARATDFDAHSIMTYPIDELLTVGGFSVGWNGSLSDSDKAYIKAQYPGKSTERELVVGGPELVGDLRRAGQVDRYSLAVSVPEHVRIEARPERDLVLRLVRTAAVGAGRDLATHQPTDLAGIEARLEPGTYDLRVRHRRPGATGRYRVVARRLDR